MTVVTVLSSCVGCMTCMYVRMVMVLLKLTSDYKRTACTTNPKQANGRWVFVVDSTFNFYSVKLLENPTREHTATRTR